MRNICFIVQYVRVRGCVVGDAFAGFAPLVCAFVFARARVRANACEMEQMAFRPRVCVIEKSPYVFAGLTKCKHTMLQREEKHRRG